MEIEAVVEYNSKGYLIYAENFPGAFARGKSQNEAMAKMPDEIRRYLRWTGTPFDPSAPIRLPVVQTKESTLQIHDADSDVIFDTERPALTREAYLQLKALAIKSAKDFQTLYDSVPDKSGTVLSPRKTFYGDVPLTAEDMYAHTKNVNRYYFGEIGVGAGNDPDIVSCRMKGFEELELFPDFLENRVYDGSYGELWSLRKVCRRFIWHDRIHAKAMYRMAVKLCGSASVADPFYFAEETSGG